LVNNGVQRNCYATLYRSRAYLAGVRPASAYIDVYIVSTVYDARRYGGGIFLTLDDLQIHRKILSVYGRTSFHPHENVLEIGQLKEVDGDIQIISAF
jgi:hypothetical protein